MTKNKLRSSIQKTEKETGLNYNAILIMYFLESVLKRIAVSPYKKSFKNTFEYWQTDLRIEEIRKVLISIAENPRTIDQGWTVKKRKNRKA